MHTRLIILTSSLVLASCGEPKPLMLGGTGTANERPEIEIDPADTSDTGRDQDSDSDDTGHTDTGGVDDTGATTTDTGGDTGADIEGTGYGRGDTAYDLLTTDHFGLPFSLYALYGSPVVLLVGDLYDARATDTLTGMGALVSEHSGVHFVALIGQDASTTHCDASCAAGVASDYGIPTVLYDPSPALPLYATWSQSNAPRLYIIDATMTIDWVNFGTTTEAQLDDKLDDLD